MTTTLAYRSDPALRGRMIALTDEHAAADRIVSGHYGHDGDKWNGGCSIGCTIESAIRCGVLSPDTPHGRHAALADLGIPPQLAYLFDYHFEQLDGDAQIAWTGQWQRAIPCGADLSGVWPAFVVRMLDRILARKRRTPLPNRVRKAIERVRDLYRDGFTPEQMLAAARAAAAAADAADAAADAAAYAARAARAADAADAARAARAAAYAAYAARAARAADAADAARAARAADAADAARAARAAAYAADAAYAAYAAYAADAARAARAADAAAERATQRADLLELLASAPVPSAT